MNRRQALFAALTATGAMGVSERSEGKDDARKTGSIPGAVPLRIGQAMDLKIQSNPLRYKNEVFFMLSIDKCDFEIDGNFHLTAKLHTSIQQWDRVDCWISVAVFDAAAKLLGVAAHKEEVKRIQVSRTVMVQRDIALDFGISKTFAGAAFLVVAISEVDLSALEERGEVK